MYEQRAESVFFLVRLGLVLMGGEHQEALSVDIAQMRSGERESVHSLPALDPRAPMPVSKRKHNIKKHYLTSQRREREHCGFNSQTAHS